MVQNMAEVVISCGCNQSPGVSSLLEVLEHDEKESDNDIKDRLAPAS